MTDEPLQPNPLDDPNFRESRALYLSDWSTLVLPYLNGALNFVGHSVTYGSTALQAGYILNGGALAALPALLTSLTNAGANSIAVAAIPFVVGISMTAVSSFCAYINFQFHAQVWWFDSDKNAAMLGRFYQKRGVDPDPKRRDRYTLVINITLIIGVLAGILSLVSFAWGSWSFIELARHSQKPPAITYAIAPPKAPTQKIPTAKVIIEKDVARPAAP